MPMDRLAEIERCTSGFELKWLQSAIGGALGYCVDRTFHFSLRVHQGSHACMNKLPDPEGDQHEVWPFKKGICEGMCRHGHVYMWLDR